MARKKNKVQEVIRLVERIQESDVTPEQSVPLITQAPELPPVDDWICPPEMEMYKSIDKAIIIPVARFYGIEDPNNSLNIFNISAKRCYNRPEMRQHTTTYLNYFHNFFDMEGELYTMYAKIKYMIDIVEDYEKEDFIRDIKKYILFNISLLYKIYLMNIFNYQI